MSELRLPSPEAQLVADLNRQEESGAMTAAGLSGESRLLLVLPGELPVEVVTSLQQSPLLVEEVAENLLGSGPLAPGDTILVGDVRRLGQVVQALEKRRSLNTPIIAIGHPSRLQLDEERLRNIKLTVFPRTWDASQVVRRTIQLVVQHLKTCAPAGESGAHSPHPLTFVPPDKSAASASVSRKTSVKKAASPMPKAKATTAARTPAAPTPARGIAHAQTSEGAKKQRASTRPAAARKLARVAARPHPVTPQVVVRAGKSGGSQTSKGVPLPAADLLHAEAFQDEDKTRAWNPLPELLAGGGSTPPEANAADIELPRPAALPRIAQSKSRLRTRPASNKTPHSSSENQTVRPSAPQAATSADTSPTQLSFRAPVAVQELATKSPPVEVRVLQPRAEAAEMMPHAPPSSHRRVSSRPPSPFVAESAQRSDGRFSLPPVSMAPDGRTLRATRWVVVDDDDVRVQAVATCLRQLGAKVETLSLSQPESKIAPVRQLDAIGYIIDEHDVPRAARLLSAFEADPRMRWMRLVSLRWREVFDESSNGVVIETLTRCLELHWETEWETLEQLLQGLEVGVARLGMARVLMAASKTGGARVLRVASLAHDYALSLLDGAVVAAARDGASVSGAALRDVIAEMLELSDGSAIFELESQVDAAPIARLPQLLQNHAQELSERRAISPGAWGRPVVNAARKLKLSRFRLSVTSLNPVMLALLRQNLRYYRLPIASGLAALVLVALVVAWVNRGNDGELSANAVAPEPAGSGAKNSGSGSPSAEGTRLAAVAADQKPASPMAAVPKSSAQKLQKAASEASQAPTKGSSLRIPNKSCEHLLAKTIVPRGRHQRQAKSAWLLARKALQRGEIQLAEERFCLSAHLDPEGRGVEDLVRFYFSQNDVAAAKAGAEWALTERAADPEIKQLLADALNAQGDSAGARLLLIDSMGIQKDDAALLAKVSRRFASAGHKALKGGDPSQAERLFRRAVSLDDSNLLGSTGLAQLALNNHSLPDAEHWARRSVELEPRSFQAQFVLGEVLSINGKKEQAVAAYRVALQLNPGSNIVRKRLGM